MSQNPYVGVGLYTVTEAARLLHVPAPKLRRWALGDPLASRAREPKRTEPLIKRELPPAGKLILLTFAELIELQLINAYRQHGISMRIIRKAARRAAKLFRTDHPFALRQFHTEGSRIFAEITGAGEWCKDQAQPQPVLDEIARPFFLNLDYQSDYPRQYWPLGRDKGIVLDPARCFGEPIDAASGVPTATLYQLYTAGESVEDVAKWYRATPEAVRAAIEYERSLAA